MPTYNKLGPYHCIRTLGEGTFAQVVLGKDERSKELVALKVIKHTMDRIDQRRAAYLQTEVGIMRKLQHKHVIGLREVRREDAKKKSGKLETVIVIVFDYAAGGELYETLYLSSSFEDPVARTYFHQLVLGLTYCHELRIAHRDLKPQNLLLDGLFNLKIGDFGFAKLLDSTESLMHTNCGTPAYQAPELRDSEQRKKGYTVAADIWACGVILFFMLTGRTPFQRAELTDPTCKYLFDQEYAKFWEIHTAKTGSFFSLTTQDFINKMLTVDPARRITVQAMLKHPWFQGPQIPHESLIAELRRRREMVKLKKKKAKLRARNASRRTASISTASPLPSQASTAPSQQGSTGHQTGTGQTTGDSRVSVTGSQGGSQTGFPSTNSQTGSQTGSQAQPSPAPGAVGQTFTGDSIEKTFRGFQRMTDKYRSKRAECNHHAEQATLPLAMDEAELEMTTTFFESKEKWNFILWRLEDEFDRMHGDMTSYRKLRAKLPALRNTEWLEFGEMDAKQVEHLFDGKSLDAGEELELLRVHENHSHTERVEVIKHHSDADAARGKYHLTFRTQGKLTPDIPLEIHVQVFRKFGPDNKALDGSPLHIVQFTRRKGDGFEYCNFYDYFEFKVDDLVYLEEDERTVLAERESKGGDSDDDDDYKPSEKPSAKAVKTQSLYSSSSPQALEEQEREHLQQQDEERECRLKEIDDGFERSSSSRFIPDLEPIRPEETKSFTPPNISRSIPPSITSSTSTSGSTAPPLSICTATPPQIRRAIPVHSLSSSSLPLSTPPTITRQVDPASVGGGQMTPSSSFTSQSSGSQSPFGSSGPTIVRAVSVPAPSPRTMARKLETVLTPRSAPEHMRNVLEQRALGIPEESEDSPFGSSAMSPYSPLPGSRELSFTSLPSSSSSNSLTTTTPLTPSGLHRPLTPTPTTTTTTAPTTTTSTATTTTSAPEYGYGYDEDNSGNLYNPPLQPIGSQKETTGTDSTTSLYEVREKKEFNLTHIWSEVEKKIKVVDDHIQWSDLIVGMNEAINLIFIAIYPAYVPYGAIFFSEKEAEEFKKIRGGMAGPKIPVTEYKFVWLKHIESYLRCLVKIPFTWFNTPRIFHGPMSRSTAEQMLTEKRCQHGTLIVRYSHNSSGLCFSSKRSDGAIQHIELKLSADASTLSIQWDKEIRRRFTNIEAIVWQSPLYLHFYPDLSKASILNPSKKDKDKEKESLK